MTASRFLSLRTFAGLVTLLATDETEVVLQAALFLLQLKLPIRSELIGIRLLGRIVGGS